MKQRAFVRYTKSGKIVPGSLIETSGSYPSGPSLWYEVQTDLCCTTTTTTSTTTTSTTTTTTTAAPEFITFNVTATGGNVVNVSMGGTFLNGYIDWGNGNTQNFVNAFDPAYSQTYAAGTYTATVYVNNPQNLEPLNTSFGVRVFGSAVTSVDLSTAPNFPIITINNTSVSVVDASSNIGLRRLNLYNNPITLFTNIILPTSPITPIRLLISNLQITTINLTSAYTGLATLETGIIGPQNAGPLSSVSLVGTPPNLIGLTLWGVLSLTNLTINTPNLITFSVRNANLLTSAGLVFTNISGVTSFSLGIMPLFTTFSIDASQAPSLQSFGVNDSPALTSLQATNFTTLAGISIQGNTSLTTVNLTASTGNLTGFYANGSSLSQTTINNLLIALDANTLSNGTFWSFDGLNGIPSGGGITAKNNLIAKGWDVLTN